MAKKILVGGIQSTGRPHIGNYFGAMKQFVDLQNEYDARIFVADMHSFTTAESEWKNIGDYSIGVILDYLAIGLDLDKVLLYRQSDAPRVAELCWYFNCITTMPYLMRSHAYKDAEAKKKEISLGTFSYPMLMAADILIHDADVVPVGRDQKQHIECARDTAEKFNRIFGETFKLPSEFTPEEVAIVPGLDGEKMSKSKKNTIPLFASDEEIEAAVKKIVTDSNGGIPQNVYNIHKLLRDERYLQKLYQENEGKYKNLKDALIEDLKTFIRPLREKRAEFEKRLPEILEIVAENGKKADVLMAEKMIEVKRAMGLMQTH
jgi:tryptophanyl-tRNA synthetase